MEFRLPSWRGFVSRGVDFVGASGSGRKTIWIMHRDATYDVLGFANVPGHIGLWMEIGN